ncbi:MAG: periplasmic sensor signal transduction histidine kinase [Myxococcales bacterium]|nr:periplasmic sensor signal transduction histidine kinase [Myxococcales bacterium]
MKRTSHVGLQLKLTVALVLIVMTPLAASYFLIDQIGKVAANFAAGEAGTHVVVMDKALEAYRDLIETTKRLHAEVADRLSKRPALVALDPKLDLDKIIDNEPGLNAIAMLMPDGRVITEASRPVPGPQWREKVLDQSLGTSGASLRLTFLVPATLQDDYQALKKQVDDARSVVTQYREALEGGYKTAFLVVMALAALVAAAFGIFASTIVTRRIEALVTTARRVSDGHHDARVELRGSTRDEMAELGNAFNTMLDDLSQTRGQVEYLQRIGAWQDVARRLAHEIKNPLTPIQLAVQQTVSSYKGDDARFAKLLQDTGEIVEEEIEGLRRLVDTFRTLGQLPKVEKSPLALADTIEELKLDPTFAAKLELVPPAEPVTVRADKLLLKRVLANLVENGIHAGQEAGTGGKVIVSWRAEPGGETVTITVDDHGKGVADADRDRIFEPYVTSKATGTGLGLAIARKIAIEHGGDLAIAPGNAPTGGARFVVSLPLRGPESSHA